MRLLGHQRVTTGTERAGSHGHPAERKPLARRPPAACIAMSDAPDTQALPGRIARLEERMETNQTECRGDLANLMREIMRR